MKKMGLILVALVGLLTPALAADQISVERGKELFNSTQLGSNQKSCATCHPNGSKLAKAASYDEKQLVKIVNRCIQKALAGKQLPADSADMASMVMYLRTLAAL
jgi:cytochrome c